MTFSFGNAAVYAELLETKKKLADAESKLLATEAQLKDLVEKAKEREEQAVTAAIKVCAG